MIMSVISDNKQENVVEALHFRIINKEVSKVVWFRRLVNT